MRILIVFITFLSIPSLSTGQGCSDAGLCTVSGLDLGFDKNKIQTTGKFYTIIGLGEQNVFHITTQFEVVIPTFKNQTVQIKLP